MNVFFEESGSFKAGVVLSRQGDAFQVELPGGRRVKVKSKNVLLEFCAPAADELMQAAHAYAQEIDPDFLWRCANDDTFSFTALADEYFGTGAAPAQRAALALRLASAPIYFRRKGRGQYQRAPEEQIKAALAALARREQQTKLQAAYVAELAAHRLPQAFKDKVIALLTRQDKHSIEYKALEAAALARNVSAAQLMLDCGAIRCARALHEARFRAEYFPQGTEFETIAAPPVEAMLDALPISEVAAFSIDDVSTTEIDDAFSVQRLSDGRLRIGVHIAAPALGIMRGDKIDLQARTRLSTVYAPGDKITMLPDTFIDIFTLKEGGLRPAVSLYIIVDSATLHIVASETRVERIFVAHNLRYNWLDTLVTEEALATGGGSYPHQAEIAALWPFAQALYEKRQQARISYGLKRETARPIDFNFAIDGEQVSITPRRRGAPLDLIVAELAILANRTWGKLLAEYDVPGIYRVHCASGPNRTRMQTAPAPHEGLGVAQYAWSTSPLRRYVDLVNQWQLLACAQHGVAAKLVAPFKLKETDLYAIIQRFDEIYSAYADYQSRMERFWCLRWLKQEKRARVTASLVKGGCARLDEIPLLVRVPELGAQAQGVKLLLDIVAIDELSIEASCRLVQVLNANTNTAQDGIDSEPADERESTSADDKDYPLDKAFNPTASKNDCATPAPKAVFQPARPSPTSLKFATRGAN